MTEIDTRFRTISIALVIGVLALWPAMVSAQVSFRERGMRYGERANDFVGGTLDSIQLVVIVGYAVRYEADAKPMRDWLEKQHLSGAKGATKARVDSVSRKLSARRRAMDDSVRWALTDAQRVIWDRKTKAGGSR